jgi:P-type Ca2+ transporter type 2C
LPADLDIRTIQGLTESEARLRLQNEGPNELPATKPRSIFAIAWEVVREPMFLLLVGCGVLYLLMGELKDAAMLLGFVFVVMGITFYQERKTERALEALRDLSSPRALVIREGHHKRVAGREVVRGDVLVLAEGDRVPADAILIWCRNLTVDESLLTGESVAVGKRQDTTVTAMGRPGGEDSPFIYSGTLVVQGQGIAAVAATGANTELGKIGKALQTLEPEDTPLQKQTGVMVRRLALVGLFLCIIVVTVYGITRHNWTGGLLAGLTLAMSILPEELPVILTIFLALGAWRISQKHVLTRRVPAVETLGAATVLCVDKTGTLTMNQMSVAQIFAGGEFYGIASVGQGSLPEKFHEVLEYGILASKVDPFDPMEKALRKLGDQTLHNTEHLHNDWSLIQEYPLSHELLALSHVWQAKGRSEYVIATKGAPEAIFDLCHLAADETERLSQQVITMANEGLRVLGVAKTTFQKSQLPEQQHDFAYSFVGLVGLADPIRPEVPQAVAECYTAGIRVIMITGDYPGTAVRIAAQIGLKPDNAVITGAQLDSMEDAELQEKIRAVCIFARVVPEQKLRLVNALKANGEIVAMTGDGVNDAPALKSAHIGVAMGGRGTDVAREAGSIVLLDDNFSSIVQAVRLGRRIFDNIRKAIVYVFAIHVPIAGLSLIPVFRENWQIILFPVHVVFLELIIDPTCSIIFEAEEAETNVMHRPPRNSQAPLFSRRMVTIGILQGLFVLTICFGVYYITLQMAKSEHEARAMMFTTLIVSNLGLILTNRSWSKTALSCLYTQRNPALWWVVGGAAIMLGLILYIPFLQKLFKFAPLHLPDLFLCLSLGITSILWFEIMKLFRKTPM